MRTTDIPESSCPKCGEILNAATSMEDIQPKPGDLTICINCASMLRFDKDLSMRELSIDEFMELHDEERIALKNMQKTMMEMIGISNLHVHNTK
jgi:hypothetical protein